MIRPNVTRRGSSVRRRFVDTGCAAAVVLFLSMAMPSSADATSILPSGTSPVESAVAGGFDWTYDALLTAGSQLQVADFFTIYDFGVGSFVSAPVGWTLTTSPLGVNPVGITTGDSPSLLNFTFTYSAGPIITGLSDLGNFSLFSTTGTRVSTAFASQEHDVTGALGSSITSVQVPGTPTSPVPEPGTIFQLSGGLSAFLYLVRSRPRRDVSAS
jgi:hypothetical protein